LTKLPFLIPAATALSGVMNGRLQGLAPERDLRHRQVAVEQHAPFEEGRTEKRIALMYPLGDARIMDRHQTDRLCQQRVGTRIADQAVEEGTTIKRLMLGTHSHEEMFRREIFGGEPG